MGNKLSLMGNLPDGVIQGVADSSDDLLGDLEAIAGNGRAHHYRKHINRATLGELENDYINGVYDDDSVGINGVDGIGKKKNKEQRAARREKIKATRKKVFKGAKKLGFAPVRAAFLLLIASGKYVEKTPLHFNLAKKLAELWAVDGGVSIKSLWTKFGGKPDVLKKAIIKASKANIQGIAGGVTVDGIGATTEAIIAAVTAAAPILVGVTSLLVKHGKMKKQDAARAEEGVERLDAKLVDRVNEETGKEPDLMTEATRIVKTGGQLVQDAIKQDDGGDKHAQDTIVNTPTPNDSDPQANSRTASPNTNLPTSRPMKTAKEELTEGAELPQTNTTTHSGFSLYNASSWLNGALMTPIMGAALHLPNMLTGTVSGLLLIGAIGLTIKNSLIKTK